MNRTRIKFCGMTSADDVRRAVEAGADAVGFIFAHSPRRLRFEQIGRMIEAAPPYVTRVAVLTEHEERFVPELLGLGFTLQFSGDEEAESCERLSGGLPYVKAFHVKPGGALPPERELEAYRHALRMFDTFAEGRGGGAGVPFGWEIVAEAARARPIVVAGGLTPHNVAACVRSVRPYAVDVRSGVERDGKKDLESMRAFVRAVREADAEA